MIATLWHQIVGIMTGIGWFLVQDESDLAARRYTIQLPAVAREPDVSTFARLAVQRDVRLRLQYPQTKDAGKHLKMNQDIESIANAFLVSPYLFESARLEERDGGFIAEVVFSANDRMS